INCTAMLIRMGRGHLTDRRGRTLQGVESLRSKLAVQSKDIRVPDDRVVSSPHPKKPRKSKPALSLPEMIRATIAQLELTQVGYIKLLIEHGASKRTTQTSVSSWMNRRHTPRRST